MQSITVPVSVTFTIHPDPKHKGFFSVFIVGVRIADIWHGILEDSTFIEMDNQPDIVVHGPDETQRTAEALTQLAARLFTVPV